MVLGGSAIDQTGVVNQSKTIRLPVRLIDKIYKLYRASLTMSEES